jgi:Ni,Fe-hydrogenase I small subunit
MKNKLLLALLLTSSKLMACPGCAGSMENSKQGNLVPILIIFIALTYIPFYMIYKMIIKHRNFNDELEQLNNASKP